MNKTLLLSMLTAHWDKPSSANWYNDDLMIDILWFKTEPEEVTVTFGGKTPKVKQFTTLDDALEWAIFQPQLSKAHPALMVGAYT